MNTRQLEAFKAVMELGSFTRAGERLNLTQPAVSKLIMLMERKCGFSLFHRTGNGVVPSAEAEMLFEEVDRVFAGVRTIEARIEAIRDFDLGEINIVAFPSLSSRVLPPVLAEFAKAKPGVKLSLYSRHSWQLVDKVASQGIDIGIGMVRTDRPGVTFERLCSMEAVCVMSPQHRLAGRSVVTAADLDGERLISLIDEDRAQLDIDRALHEAQARCRVVMQVQLTEAVCTMASTDAGVAVVDPLSTVDFSPDRLAVRPFVPAITYDIWIVSPAFRTMSRSTRLLAAHFRDRIGASVQEIQDRIVRQSQCA